MWQFLINSSCTFSAAGLEPARHFLDTPLPASAAGLCPYMADAGSQSAGSRQLHSNSREMRRVGTANRNEPNHTALNNIAQRPAGWPKTIQRGDTIQQSNTCNLYSAF